MGGDRISSKQVFRWAAAGTLGVLVVFVCAYAMYVVRDILLLVLVALFLAISLDPVVRWLTRRKIPRAAAVAIVFVVAIALTAAFIWSTVPPLVEQGDRLVHDFPAYLRRLSDNSTAVREVIDRYQLGERLGSLISGVSATLANGAVGFFQGFVGTLGSTVTVLVLTIYFSADMPRIRDRLVQLAPRPRRRRVAAIVEVMVDKVGSYMIGNLFISAIAGTAAFVCLVVLGVPFALPLAVSVAVLDLVPMVGATLGAVICVLVALFTVGLWPGAVLLVVFFIVYQQVENYVLTPRVFRGTVNMPAGAVLLVALIGASLLGLVGAVMAIPVAATVKVALSSVVPGVGDEGAK
ncbi:AI-2E family transporter [Kutzneria buriramensis]|uniref:Putative PurR-regulated permease PerM n=1 Tax=Kutzneria buriramensis TaxID=1045776 RepID=A0A3E0HFW5_9PSEU|nr:AI-2E family transporter [Kutzneria buriramensis]REH44643.1 putative PurR-regulated permease PerM [Kutzneria buriramensis]